ncbi:helix-turn-helix transcriptional regulator [Mycolicibacterium arseniciresistens]|uniref:Helix-turn-helix transcriptional regulator n=1 Tax=Mycolicibacterium arseniciresistens TaxID=3062257 RepID=A0ABT8ULC8_9MYCO|nr:helix-turn-helix transcriptional regulator [Mycolicibacterium arseniciresistens]MDO3638613.1 helix-turn-helix transcriptional regulator [Mycolicibacterium arseniciresistens]
MDGQAAGRFLRAVRESREPADFGFSAQGRRTSGLRRSEVAELAHISVEHYTNVERARGSAPSDQVVAAIADALRLHADERRHLFQLIGRSVPLEQAPSMEVTPSVAELVAGLGTTAAMVLSARFDVLAWNAEAVVLMEDFGAIPPAERNIARRHFLPPPDVPPHYGMTGGAEFSRIVVGQLRATVARYPRDPMTRALIADLCAGSPEFAELWDDATVITVTHMIKRLDHPELGRLTLACDMLQDPHRDQSIVMFSVVSAVRRHADQAAAAS